jgi:hypothetical protein
MFFRSSPVDSVISGCSGVRLDDLDGAFVGGERAPNGGKGQTAWAVRSGGGSRGQDTFR